MKLWRINYEGGGSNTAKGVADIWTGTPGVASVVDLGAETTETKPTLLSKTAFMDHVVAQFVAVNGGDIGDGYERFDEVMEAARTSAQGKVRAAYKRYDAASTFSKDTTAALTQWMVDSADTGRLTTTERTAVLDNWPT